MASTSEKHMSEAHNDKEFLEFIVQSIVTNGSAVKVTRVVDEMGVLLTLDVDPADMSRVIGRMGNTAKAIRTLLRVVGMKHNARVNLKINEPEGGRQQQSFNESPREVVSHIDSTDELINDLKSE